MRSLAPASALLALAVACGARTGLPVPKIDGGEGGAGAGGGGAGGGGDGGTGLTLQPLVCGKATSITGGGAGGGGGGPTCTTDPDADQDGDGFTAAQGDCNDCDPTVNPGAIEVVALPDSQGNVPVPVDDDCDGLVDEGVATCDGGLFAEAFDAAQAAQALDLCSFIQPGDPGWGVLEASYVRADGSTPLQETFGVGVLDSFGYIFPQRGERLLALSSGHARDALDPAACGSQMCTHDLDPGPNPNPGIAPGGAWCAGQPEPCFPQDVPTCSGSLQINDDVALHVRLRTPTNANGFRYRFKYFSFEYPEWVCTAYNDQFAALVLPPRQGAKASNVSFDSAGNPVSVNVVFFDALFTDLINTGFGTWNDAGATKWLETRVPVVGGEELELLFAMWDAGDTNYDSTVLVDGFDWLVECAEVKVETGVAPQ